MPEGWIKLHRQIFESEWATDYKTNYLFIYCLTQANHIDKKWHGKEIKRGQFVTSYPKLAQQTGLSIQNVRTSLTKLKLTRNLTCKASNKYQIITITNYEEYQCTNRQTNRQLTDNQHSTNIQLTSTKKEKNKKNEKNIEGVSTKAPPQKRGTRLNDDWWIPDEWGEWAVQEFSWSIDKVVAVAEKFKDHWLSVPGAKGVKLDWLATWRNWCRRDYEGSFK